MAVTLAGAIAPSAVLAAARHVRPRATRALGLGALLVESAAPRLSSTNAARAREPLAPQARETATGAIDAALRWLGGLAAPGLDALDAVGDDPRRGASR